MITSKQIIDKFCSGPVAEWFAPEAIQACQECQDLEELIAAVSINMDFDYDAQAASFIMKYLDWEAN